MTIATNTPTTNQFTAYPLPMIQDSSLWATHAVMECLSGVVSCEVECAVYILDWPNRQIVKIPGSTFVVPLDTIGVQTIALETTVILRPRQQYYVGFVPNSGGTIRVVGDVTTPINTVDTAPPNTASLLFSMSKGWYAVPWVQLLSTKGSEVL